MTPLSPIRKTVRETNAVVRGKRLVVELTPHTLLIRPKGARWAYEVDWDAVFMLGAKQQAERDRLNRKKGLP